MEMPIWCLVTMIKTRVEAESLGEAAVQEDLAACAQVEGPVLSIYRWGGQVQREEEMRVVFKTSRSKACLLAAWIKARHPYDVPEIIAWPTELSDPDYRNWVNDG